MNVVEQKCVDKNRSIEMFWYSEYFVSPSIQWLRLRWWYRMFQSSCVGSF